MLFLTAALIVAFILNMIYSCWNIDIFHSQTVTVTKISHDVQPFDGNNNSFLAPALYIGQMKWKYLNLISYCFKYLYSFDQSIVWTDISGRCNTERRQGRDYN